MRRRAPKQNYQKKRPLQAISKEACADDPDPLDPKAAYQDPYTLDSKEDDTEDWDSGKHGREQRALFDDLMRGFSDRVQASSRRRTPSGRGRRGGDDDGGDQTTVIEREVCDKIECVLRPFFMKHAAASGGDGDGGVDVRTAQTLAEFCRLLVRCGAKRPGELPELLRSCAAHPSALVYLPCVSTSYVRVTVVLQVGAGVVRQFVIENGWRKEVAFIQH
ncbi:MAG: hypothetical protein CMI16_07320 [Opitutaceae bacterium]|nr:hypothetical protein [Opitutaceae bacterium]|tara:strand:+ start:1506 stop:2162 length:657 start_codon:yes stop_codon:yes gene_type:complete